MDCKKFLLRVGREIFTRRSWHWKICIFSTYGMLQCVMIMCTISHGSETDYKSMDLS